MKLKNREINEISSVLTSMGNRTNDIKLRFDLAKKMKPITIEIETINNEIQKIIKEKNEKDKEVTSLNIFDDEYVQLMEYENEIDFVGFDIDYLSKFNPSVGELCKLEKIIIG